MFLQNREKIESMRMNKINKEMRESFGKRVRVTCVDGEVLEGECKYFTPALDNENGRASIVVISGGNIEVFENEIAKIEMI